MEKKWCYGVIYIIKNSKNNKVYIGQTKNDINKRFGDHKCKSVGSIISKAIQKHGRENFSIDIIDYATTLKELNEKEIFWINKFNSINPSGYNICNGGQGNCNYDRTNEVREKIKKSICKLPPKKNKASKYKGVSWDRENKKWYAIVYRGKKPIEFFLHSSEKTCARIRDRFALKHFGEGCYLNFPDEVMSDEEFELIKQEKINKKTTPYVGVYKDSYGAFCCSAYHNKKLVYIGRFKTVKEAAIARNEYIDKHELKLKRNDV